MAYIVIKTIRGRRYRYLQRSWREGRKVRTESKYLGVADGSDALGSTFWREVREADEEQRKRFGETGQERADRERQEHLDKLHEDYGLTMPSGNPDASK